MKYRKCVGILCAILLFSLVFAAPAWGITEEEVQAQIESQGRDVVVGNLFIWFICCVGFLKVAQKMDTFLSGLGLSVGHTGGSMLMESMLVMKSLASIRNSGGHGGRAGGSSSSAHGGTLSGGLAGMIGRKISGSAMAGATGQGGNPVTRKLFASSLKQGGGFANGIIGSVAKGDISRTGTISGNTATAALTSYLGFSGQEDAPQYTDVEIGGGRIMGTETSAAHPEGTQFAMYHADQYLPPDQGEYSTVTTTDGAKWYMQYARDTVEKTPSMTPEGKIKYDSKIVTKLPPIPKRKDRV